MNDQLITPIVERISLGHAKEDIKKEVLGFGYTESEFEAAYAVAQAQSGASSQKDAFIPTPQAQSVQPPAKGSVLTIVGSVLVVVALIGVIGAAGVMFLKTQPTSDPFADGAYEEWLGERTEDQIVDLVRPSVVRVMAHIVGTTTIPHFDIDYETLALSLEDTNKEPVERAFDRYVSGSGFIVSPDGKIVTNAHVVSPETVRLFMFGQHLFLEALQQTQYYTEEESDALEAQLEALGRDDDGSINRSQLEFMFNNTDLEYTAEVYVINPNSDADSFNAQLEDAVPARVLSVNEDYLLSDEDVALISIDQDALPVLTIQNPKEVSIGDRVYAFGYPAVTDLSQVSVTQSSFTDGTVSSLKNSQHNAFEVIQTNAKIAKGSSGGPLVNSDGEVVGVITLQTSSGAGEGDNFAFAIPSDIVRGLSGYEATEETGESYRRPFLKGLFLRDSQHCKQAIEQFESVPINETFSAASSVNRYIAECQDMIARGDSIDTRYEELIKASKSSTNLLVVVAAVSGVAILVVIVLVLIIFRQVRKNRNRLQTME